MTELKIGLLWHSVNSDNLGVGALTASNIAIVESVARSLGHSVRFVVLGWKDPEPVYISGPNIEFLPLSGKTILSPSGLLATVRSCDFVLDISAGDSFADIYGTKRFLFNIASKMVVMLARRPLVLSPQTIGPFSRWWARMLAVWAMKQSRTVVSRDALSSDYARELGVGHKLLEATDVAFRLPYDQQARTMQGRTKVGLNLSGLLLNGGYSGKNMFSLASDYPRLARELCQYFADRDDCELHLVGHVNSRTMPVEDDFRAAEALAAEFPGTIVAPRFANPSEAKSYISGLDFFAGSRMHACIAAFSSGVPVLPLAYSRKFAGLFGTLGYDHYVDCRTDDNATILQRVQESFEAREMLRADVDEALSRAGAKLKVYEDLLAGLLNEAQSRHG